MCRIVWQISYNKGHATSQNTSLLSFVYWNSAIQSDIYRGHHIIFISITALETLQFLMANLIHYTFYAMFIDWNFYFITYIKLGWMCKVSLPNDWGRFLLSMILYTRLCNVHFKSVHFYFFLYKQTNATISSDIKTWHERQCYRFV